jgi:hypothetical protein
MSRPLSGRCEYPARLSSHSNTSLHNMFFSTSCGYGVRSLESQVQLHLSSHHLTDVLHPSKAIVKQPTDLQGISLSQTQFPELRLVRFYSNAGTYSPTHDLLLARFFEAR